MKHKVKLKIEFLNTAFMVVGTSHSEIQVQYPLSQPQAVVIKIKGDIKPCRLTHVRVLRFDGAFLVTVEIGDIFVGDNKQMAFDLGLILNPQHVEFLSKVPA